MSVFESFLRWSLFRMWSSRSLSSLKPYDSVVKLPTPLWKNVEKTLKNLQLTTYLPSVSVFPLFFKKSLFNHQDLDFGGPCPSYLKPKSQGPVMINVWHSEGYCFRILPLKVPKKTLFGFPVTISCPQKTFNIDTKNYALEKVTPFKRGDFGWYWILGRYPLPLRSPLTLEPKQLSSCCAQAALLGSLLGRCPKHRRIRRCCALARGDLRAVGSHGPGRPEWWYLALPTHQDEHVFWASVYEGALITNSHVSQN